jgi:SAM-dependent methyltransferase
MDRGYDGVLPRTPRLEDESYLDFMETVRNFAIGELFPRLGAQAEAAATRAGLADGETPAMEAIEAAVRPLPLFGAWQRVMRSQQQMTWRKIAAAWGADAEAYEASLAAAESARPDRLHYDPAFEVPPYATLDIHLQPGGYTRDPLAGAVFHHGTRVFYQGFNDQDELHRQIAADLALPADAQVSKVLDVGCSIGQCTTAVKQRLPEAEVWGLDVGLPLLRYAHKRAVDLDVDVHFQLGLAEDLPFEDGSFDAVLAYILFHEVPERLFAPILAEMHRVLRPGGTLTIVDAPNGRDFPIPNRLWLAFDARYNCEPYSPGFVAADLPALLDGAGFTDVESGPTPTFLTRTVAVKPAA